MSTTGPSKLVFSTRDCWRDEYNRFSVSNSSYFTNRGFWTENRNVVEFKATDNKPGSFPLKHYSNYHKIYIGDQYLQSTSLPNLVGLTSVQHTHFSFAFSIVKSSYLFELENTCHPLTLSTSFPKLCEL